jgi:hypothetical protein
MKDLLFGRASKCVLSAVPVLVVEEEKRVARFIHNAIVRNKFPETADVEIQMSYATARSNHHR